MPENIKKNNRRKAVRIGRADICIMVFFLLLALGIFGWSAVGRKAGRNLRISYDGRVIAEIPFAQAAPANMAGEDSGAVCYGLISYSDGGAFCEWYEERPELAQAVSMEGSYNLVAVGGERVWMEAADCRDQICVHHISIADSGESIICLPHKLVVELVGGTAETILDAAVNMENAGETVWNERGRVYEKDG